MSALFMFYDLICGWKIELLNQTGSLDKSLEVHQSLNSNSISELLSPKLRNMAKPAIYVALNNSSIEELLNPKTGSPTMGEYQPLNSNSIGELLSPIPGVIEKSPAGNKVLNNSSIDEMLAPKADRSQRESFQPLTSNSISLAMLLKEICVRA